MKQEIIQHSSTDISLFSKYANVFNESQFNFIRYDKNKKKWMNCQMSEFINVDSCLSLSQNCKLTTLTLNVLTDNIMDAPLKRNILFSSERYHYILEYLKQIQPEIITLNEVTLNFYSMLTESFWMKQRYWISDSIPKHGFFNVIATRIPPIGLRKIKLNGLGRHIITAYFFIKLQSAYKILSISCAHFISLAKNADRRKNQLQQLTQQLMKDKNSIDISIYKNIIYVVQGDLNIHNQYENDIFNEFGWQDAWIHRQKIEQSQKLNDGYTFDGEINSMIKQVYWGFEARRMRLDRVIYMGQNIKFLTMSVVLNKPVYDNSENNQTYYRMGFLKGVVSFVGDVIGYNLFRKKEKYLFPSDHFGILSSLKITND